VKQLRDDLPEAAADFERQLARLKTVSLEHERRIAGLETLCANQSRRLDALEADFRKRLDALEMNRPGGKP
jgi:hypothetical protein